MSNNFTRARATRDAVRRDCQRRTNARRVYRYYRQSHGFSPCDARIMVTAYLATIALKVMTRDGSKWEGI